MSKENPGVFIDSLSSAERKEAAMSRGLLAYFPDALALVARHSVRSNEKHNPGMPVHWAREKSTDHEDCIVRHSTSIAIDPNSLDDGQPHMICRAWRALAALQLWAEAQHAAKAEPAEEFVRVQSKKDGVWAHFRDGKGGGFSLNLDAAGPHAERCAAYFREQGFRAVAEQGA